MPSLPEISVPQDAGRSPGASTVFLKPRRFEFERDTFAFANELVWEYAFDAASGKTTFSQRQPKPDYTHRCFVVVRVARQFFDHARFAVNQPAVGVEGYRQLIRAVLARDARKPCENGQEIIIPGFAGLRELSQAHEHLLKAECGGAWRSYVMRSHWRMVFPISRRKQVQVKEQLTESIHRHGTAIVHLVCFRAHDQSRDAVVQRG